ncbi:MAG: PhoH family protein [Spirochaetales bacterium]|nr:PhoH family protein [Spirochaetales bacterium]
MTTQTSIIINDEDSIPEICGPNDINLKIIEQELSAPIFFYGNEFILRSDDIEKQYIFRHLIPEIRQHLKLGQNPDEHLIHEIILGLRKRGDIRREVLREHFISISRIGTVYPKNFHQADYISSIQNHDMCFSVGPAGTGKTFLAIAQALKELLEKQKNKIVLTRPVVEAGESLGFLPGDLSQKLNPYLRPLYDAMDKIAGYEIINKLEESRQIEIAPLAYMRGRSISNAFIILDEAQNTSVAQMKMFLTRLGEGSKAVITGDITQIDLPKPRQSGLIHAISLLKDIPEIAIHHFTVKDVVRNPLVKKIIHAYEKTD